MTPTPVSRHAMTGAGKLLVLALFSLNAPFAQAQVPTFQEVVGHEIGQRITLHHHMVRYLESLAQSSPRVTMEVLGRSWQERELMLAVVTSPENHARLDAIQDAARRLADPRTLSPDEAANLMADQPVVVWLGGSLHGFELSGSEALLKLLERLTISDDAATMELLQNLVILIDPVLNPDGREAFANLNNDRLGRIPNPNPDDWANDFTGWEARKFRTGHYYFDINRDWFAHTQRETQARAPTFRLWRPQVAIDAHEMGADVEFYFDPPTDPVNPFFPDFSTRWLQRFGKAHAAAFDQAGYEYMTGERFNFFYPGYASSWTNYQGAVGMLYEQGSSRGLALQRPDGSVRTLADATWQQFTAAWAALNLAAEERLALLQEYYEAHDAAIAAGGEGARRYLLAPEGDPALVAELAALLFRNGVEVHVLEEPARLDGVRDRTGRDVGGRTFPAGSFVVEAAQPRGNLVRVLLEPDVPVPEDFLELARERVERGVNPRFYDITGWSLPLMFNVGGYSTADARSLPLQAVTREPAPGDVGVGPGDAADTPATTPQRPAYAYMIDGRQAAGLSALYHLRAKGHRAAVTVQPTRIQGQEFSSGTVVVPIGQNDTTVHGAVADMAERFRLEIRSVDTGLGDPGYPSLGAGDMIRFRLPNIALLAKEPVQPYSFGWAWYVLDRLYQIPATVIQAGSLAGGIPLAAYDVLILPELGSAALARMLGDAGLERIRSWVRDGGTLVTIGNATDFARGPLALLALRSWYDTPEAEGAQRFSVPGAFFRGEMDPESWLTAGYHEEMPLLVNSNRIYLPPTGSPSAARRVAATYAMDEPLLTGHVWPESMERLPGAVFAYEQRVGRGRVIAFAEDVNFRAHWRGTNRLFLNAVVLGPSAR